MPSLSKKRRQIYSAHYHLKKTQTMKRITVYKLLTLSWMGIAALFPFNTAKASTHFPLLASNYLNPYSSEGQRMAAEKMGETWSWFIVGLLVLLAIIVGVLILVRIKINQLSEKRRLESSPETYYEKASWWEIFVKAEKDTPLDAPIQGHDYDGIVELDNNPPAWFNWLFFIPIVTGLIYVMYYHVLDLGPLQDEEYMVSVEKANALLPEVVIDFSTMEALTSTEDIEAGAKIFKANCSPCHLENGGGGAGPNLTDQYWLHGGDFPSIYQTVYDGVEGKGMAAWGNILMSEQVHQVASYLETLRNTNVEDGKAPEGELYE